MAARITHVAITDYRSIGSCDVELQPLTLLVGPNGSGKSNFLDALRFLHDCMHAPLQQVVHLRFGIKSILRRLPQAESAKNCTIEIRFKLADSTEGSYALTVGEGKEEDAVILVEQCRVGDHWFRYAGGHTASTVDALPPSSGDRPLLAAFGALRQFYPVLNLINGFSFYSPSPHQMRPPSPAGSGTLLSPDASNAADVFARLLRIDSAVVERIHGYLHSINPEFNGIAVDEGSGFRWLCFTPGSEGLRFWIFNSTHASDGTLRALGILLAIFQNPSSPLTLIGLEEPETNLHPAASGVLLDALLEASNRVQIVASTHSADLLDRRTLPENALLAVALQDGETIIGPVDEAGKSILRQRLYTAGELLRSNQLSPSRA